MPSLVQPPLPLSIAIICKNNQSSIARTLDSVRAIASQIVAVDSGSTDSTLDILKQYGAEIHPQAWLGHVKQKQRALELCAEPWILSIDSDESIEPELLAGIRIAIERNDARISGYEMNRKVWYAGAFLNHAWQPEWRLRLVRKGAARWTGYDPHDKLVLNDATNTKSIARLEGVMRHDSIPSIAEFLKKQVDHGRIAAEALCARGTRTTPSRLITSPVGAFLKQLVRHQAYRDGWRGWVAAGSTAMSTLAKHLCMLERQNQTSTPNAEHDSR